MFGTLFAAFLSLLVIGSAQARVSAPNCSDSGYTWSYNSLGQSPCLVVAYLAAVCHNGTYSIPPLDSQHSYAGPDDTDNDDTCLCNTVAYNLISACDACQGEQWIPYSSWTYNCTSVAAPGIFPYAIPALTRVPLWAYFNQTAIEFDFWDESLAKSVCDSPKVTSTVVVNDLSSTSNVPSSAIDIITSWTTLPEPATSSGSVSSSNSNSNSGVIAGGVVGAVAAVALIAGGLVAWFTIHSRRQRLAPSTDYISGQGSYMGAVPYPMGTERPRLDDPSDPSTYQTRIISSPIPSHSSDSESLDSVLALHRTGNPIKRHVAMAY